MTDLLWLCDQCKEPITADGYVEVSYVALDLARNGSEPAAWHKWHEACDPERDGTHYWIDVERLRWFKDGLEWTVHFGDKGWLQWTNWIDFIDQAAQW